MKRNKRGFTLTELIIVIVIISILSVVLIPNIVSWTKRAALSNDEVTKRNLNLAVSAAEKEINDYEGLKLAIGEMYGHAYCESLSPKTAKYGNHFWYDNSENKVILSKVEDLEDKGEDAVVFNCPNSNIVYGYTLLDASGSDLARLLSGVSNICSKTELRSLVDTAINMYDNGGTYLENLIEYLGTTAIVNSQGTFRFDEVDDIFNIYFPSEFISLGTQIIYTYNIDTNTTDIHKTSLGYPIIGDGMYGRDIEIKNTMYFGSRTFIVEEDCWITLVCDVDSVEDLKDIFAAEATNAFVALANDIDTKYLLFEDKIIRVNDEEIVFEGLEYSEDVDVLNYVFPYTHKVAESITVEKSWLTGKTTTDSVISIDNSSVSAVIPEGVKVDDSQLTLSITPLDISESNFVAAGFSTNSIDVHIEGVSKKNTVPIIINIGSVLPKGLNGSAVKLYHIEDGQPILMERVSSVTTNSPHNTFSYNPSTGEVTVALKSFSELVSEIDTSNKWTGGVAEGFDRGSGTENDPYMIATVEQLAYLAQIVNNGDNCYEKYYKLENNLVINSWDLTESDCVGMEYSKAQKYSAKDFSSSATNDPAFEQKDKAYKTWIPIGNGSNEFSGIFDGNNKTISGLYKLHYDDPMSRDPMGLFGWIHDATIKNLTIDDSFIYTYGGTVGLVTGYASGNTIIQSVSVKNNFVTSYNYPLGGIVGYMWGSGVDSGDELVLEDVKIDSSNLLEALWGTYDSQVGGLVGRASENTTVTMTNCTVWPELSLYNDCCANYQWFAYRYSGMLIGYVTASDRADYLTNNVTCDNVLIKYGEWTDQYYCELQSLGKGSYNGLHDWKYTRIGKDQVIKDAQGNVTGCDETKTGHDHANNPDEDNCAINITFNQLFGGGQGVYGETPEQFTELKTNAGKESGISVKGYTSDEPETPDFSNSFECLFVNADKYLYRVGNQGTVTLGTLFKYVGGENDADSTQVSVEFENKQGTDATPTLNTTNWKNGTIQFSGVGVIRVKLKYFDQIVKTLNLEVIDAKNLTSIANISNTNAVLLGNCSMGETSYTISNGHTLYGNGFSITSNNVGLGLNNGNMAAGYIQLDNGHLENVKIICALYPRGYLYSNTTSYGEAVQDDNNLNKLRSDKDKNGNFTKKRYNYQYSAVTTTGKCSISNCYIKGARNNILIKGGSDGTVIYNTTVAYGSLANIHITDPSGTITFKNLTTIQDVFKTDLPDSVLQDGNHNNDNTKTVYGLGILVGDDESSSYPTIKIEGDFKQINWIKQGTTVSSSISNTIINAIFSGNSEYKKNINGSQYVNLGIVYMTTNTTNIDNSSQNNKDSYALGDVSLSFGSGKTYSYVGEADTNSLIIPEYSYSVDNNESSMHINEVKLKYVGLNNYLVNEEFDVQSSKLVPTIRTEINEGESASINVGDILSMCMGKTYSPTSYFVNGVEVGSSYTINSTDSGLFEIDVSGNSSGYFDEKGDFVTYYQDYDLKFKFIVLSNAIPNPKLIFNSNYDSYNNMFKRGGDNGWNGIWNVLNDVELQYYSKSRGAILTVPLNLFISGGNTKGSDHEPWVGTYDGCTLTLTSTTTIHSGSSQYGYFIVSDGVLYITNDKQVTSDYRTATIKYEVMDCNMKSTSATKARNNYKANASSKSVSTTSKYMLRLDPGLGTVSQNSFGPNAKNKTITLYTPTLENHEFLGWYDSPTGGTRKDNNLYYTTTGSNVVLFAHWRELVKYTVSFDTEGGSSDFDSYEDYSGTEFNLPSATKDGYWLVGWFNGENKVGVADSQYTIPNNNITLVAHWSPKYIVSYNMSNGGTCNTSSSIYSGTSITLPTPTPGSQPTFEGWYTAASGGTRIGGAGDSYTPTADITLYAQWSTNIPVTLDANGGSCGTTSATYDGITPITLPFATRAGYQFNGWYTATSGGTKIGNGGASYTPTSSVTIYAQWTGYVVTYNANSGSVSPSSASGVVTLPTPTRTGYTFNGWYTATSGGTKIGNGGASYTPTADITIYAQWSQQTFTVTIKAGSNGSVSPTSISNVPYGATVTVSSNTITINGTKVTATANSNYSFDKWDISNGATITSNKTITASFKSSGSCLLPNTLITLGDGTQKEIQYLVPGDMLMVFNHETGELDIAPVTFNEKEEEQLFTVIHLVFDNGENVGVISEHGFFDLDTMRYEYIDENNYLSFIDHHFYTIDGSSTLLIDAYIAEELTEVYSLPTFYHLNSFSNNILSMPGGITGLFNIFEYDETLQYNQESMISDIETYGLLTVEDLAPFGVDELMFEAYAGKYLNIAMGKGLLTEEYLIYLIERYGGYTN